MKQYLWTGGVALLAACSADLDSVEIGTRDPVTSTEALTATPEEMDAEFERKLNGALSEDEQRSVLAHMAANGVPAEAVTFSGRFVVQEGDMLIDADELLRSSSQAQIEKGFTPSFINNTGESGFVACGYQCGPFAPTLFSRMQGSQYQFLRPDVLSYYLVVDQLPGISTARINLLITWLDAAISRITSASVGDCLTTAVTFADVMTKAEYNALANPVSNQHHVITIQPYTFSSGGWHCSLEIGCANLPGNRGVRNDAKVLSFPRHRFGDRIHFNLDSLDSIEAQWIAAGQPTTGGAIAVALHELMHTMGYGHTATTNSHLLVPGTRSEANPNVNVASVPASRKGSVMRPSSSDQDGWRCLAGESGFQCLPQEDELLLTKLYGANCNFSTSFRNVN